MYVDELIFPPEDLSWLDAPVGELVFEDTPSIDEILRNNPVTLSAPLPVGQSTYTQSVTIRINRGVLAEIKKRAAAHGEKYQTFINSLLAQHAAS